MQWLTFVVFLEYQLWRSESFSSCQYPWEALSLCTSLRIDITYDQYIRLLKILQEMLFYSSLGNYDLKKQQ